MIWLLVLTAAFGAVAIAWLAVRFRRATRERELLRRRVAEMDRELEQARRVNARFLGSITHELRTPLTAILGYQELLADGIYGPLEDRCRDALARIGVAGEHLLELVDGVLEIAHIDAGRVQLSCAPVDLCAVIRTVTERAATVARERGVQLGTSTPPDLPMLVTDPARLTRTLDLALNGAIRATGGGTISVDATAAPGGCVAIEIRGAGIAVPAFGDPARAAEPEPGGSGSGEAGVGFHLSLASRFARALGGQMDLVPTGAGVALRLQIPEAEPGLGRRSPRIDALGSPR